MSGKFNSGPGGVDLELDFLTETDIFDRYVGNQLWVWGDGQFGSIGQGTIQTSRSSPVQTISGGTAWAKISTNDFSTDTIIAIKSDGTLWNWGINTTGSLGDGTRTNRSSPVQTIAGGSNWKECATGDSYSAGIKTDGTLWVWGFNSYGQLGTSNITHRSSPVQTVAGGTNWQFVSSGKYNMSAIKTDGTLWMWGRNNWGQIGDATRTARSSPVQTIAGGTNWKQLSISSFHVLAIKTDGTLWAWGSNSNGELGDTTIAQKSSPVQTIAGGTNWKQCSAGTNSSAGIKTDGTLWVWGHNNTRKLADNTTTHRSSPVQTISGGTDWKSVSMGYQHCAAIKTDGTLWLWGQNGSGQLGDGTIVHRSSPVQTLAGGNNWKMVRVMDSGTVAITLAES